MKARILMAAVVLSVAPAALQAQSPAVAQPGGVEQPAAIEAPSLHDRLMPSAAALNVTAPERADLSSEKTKAAQPVMASRGTGTAYMVAGAALFAAGIIAGGNGGTVLILAGAGIGAYGLYLHFR